MKARIALIAAATACCLAAAPQQKPEQMMGDELYAAYLANGPQALARAFPTSERFEAFRKDFRDRVLTRWETLERVPMQAMFMFDVALAAEPRHFIMWADFLLLAQTHLRQRAEPPGANPALDAFELLWNKTTIAFLEGRRQPELVEELVKRLPRRIGAEPPADGAPALVDPWIALVRGFAEEGYVIGDPQRVATRGVVALERYREASKYEATRAEATVRSAYILLESKRPADALETLDGFDERWTREGVVIYWARLIRGKVLDALGRSDEAVAAYQTALAIAPSAQSPHIGMMMAEARRNRADEADRLAQAVRVSPDPVVDPWWIYPHGDLRFYAQRLKTLREMVAK